MKTLNATPDPDREPTDFEEYVKKLETDPVEREGLEEARAALCHPTADGGDRNLIAITPEEYSELERYRAVFGDLCWTCGGSGDVPGAFDDDTSGGTKVCPGCNGRGTK